MLKKRHIGPTHCTVDSEHGIGYRVGAHGINTALDACRLIGHSHRVELTGYLFGGQLFGEVFNAQNVGFTVRFIHNTIEPEVAMYA